MEDTRPWNIEAISNALQAQAHSLTDRNLAFIPLRDEKTVVLSPFAASLIAAGGEITVYDAAPAAITEDGVSFRSTRADFGFHIAPGHEITLIGGSPRSPEAPPLVPSSTRVEAAAEKSTAMTVTGFVGTLPIFEHTKQTKQLKGSFRLRVGEGESATWHSVLAWDKDGKPRATQLRDKGLTLNQAVRIRAYPHEAIRRKAGKPVKEVEYWLAAPVSTAVKKDSSSSST